MAIGARYTLGADVTATTTSTTIAMTTTTQGNAGDRMVIAVGFRNTTPSAISASDNSGGGNTWVLDKQQDNGTNMSAGILSCVLAANLAVGTVITATGPSGSRRFLRVFGLPGSASGNPDANHIGGATGTGTAPSVATAGTTPASGDYAVSMLGRGTASGTGDSATAGGTPGTFTELSDVVVGAATPFFHAYVEEQVLASGGTVTASPTWSNTAGGWAAVIVVYVVAAPAMSLPPRRRDGIRSVLLRR